MLISDEYRNLNKKLHNDRPDYGCSGYGMYGHPHAEDVIAFCDFYKTKDVLDYGCGKKILQHTLGYKIKNYDPAIPGCDGVAEPADIVYCGDVLEHIEPECLDAVLDDLVRVVRVCGLFYVATVPSQKNLADGRNAHLIVQPLSWWLPKFEARFKVLDQKEVKNGFGVIVGLKDA